MTFHWWAERFEVLAGLALTGVITAFAFVWRQVAGLKQEVRGEMTADRKRMAEDLERIEAQISRLATATNEATDALNNKANEIQRSLDNHRVYVAENYADKTALDHAVDRLSAEIKSLRS